MRRPGRLTENALELARIAREYDLAQSRAFGTFFEGWARAERDPLGGLEDMRRGAESLREQNIQVFDGLLKIALAKAEAGAGHAERAVATLDEALATAEGLGYRAFEAELHRARGEMMLSLDPANLSPPKKLPGRYRGCEEASCAQFRVTRGAGVVQALPIGCSPGRRIRRPRPCARRFCANARNARDWRGAGAARGARRDRRVQGRRNTTPVAAASANDLRPGDDDGEGLCRGRNKGRLHACGGLELGKTTHEFSGRFAVLQGQFGISPAQRGNWLLRTS